MLACLRAVLCCRCRRGFSDRRHVPKQLVCFFKDTDEVRADLELGGLGPGLTGEHTIYSFVVGRSDSVTVGEEEMDDEAMKSNTNYKRWVLKKRFSAFHIFDKILMQIIKEEGGDETWLPEVCVVYHEWHADPLRLSFPLAHIFPPGLANSHCPPDRQFPEKALFGKMSPSLVKTRSTAIEYYLKEIVKNENLTCMPFVREFLKLPMTKEELADLDEEFEASSKCSTMCACRCESFAPRCVVSCSPRRFRLRAALGSDRPNLTQLGVALHNIRWGRLVGERAIQEFVPENAGREG
jgi:hypothetical protein